MFPIFYLLDVVEIIVQSSGHFCLLIGECMLVHTLEHVIRTMAHTFHDVFVRDVQL